MTKKELPYFFIFLFFLINITYLKAQNTQEEKKHLLETILKTLETKYNINFSYADKTIKEKTIPTPDKNLDIESLLIFLKKETNLNFKLLDKKTVTISSFKKDKHSSPKHNNTNKLQTLDEVIITNYLTTGITKLNDGSLTIKPKTLGIIPGLIEPDVLQTIQALPGVLSTDETVSNINIRGGTHDQNLILWDGIKMYQSGHFFGLISAFNPYITNRVNVYKNGTSAKYGDGVSGVIDMQLPNKIDNKFKAGTGFNLINADGHIKMPLSKKAELQLSTRRSMTDFLTTPTYNLYKKRIFQDSDLINQKESFYFYDITAKFLYDFSKKDKLRFHFFNINNQLNYDEESRISNETEIFNSNLSQRSSALGITHIRDWNKNLSTTAQIYLSNYKLGATNFDVLNQQRLIQNNKVFDGTGKLDINYKHSKTLKFNNGYQFNETGISNLEDVNIPLFKSYIKEVIRSHAIYNEIDFLSKNTQTKFKLGNRLNYIEKFNSLYTEPRLSFNQRFLNNFRFEVLGEYKSQTTSQIIDLQNDFLGIEKRRWVLSNNNTNVVTNNGQTVYPIPIVKSKQFSTGIHFSKNNLLISAESYIKNVNGITTRSQGFQNQYQFVNSIGSYDIKGIDFILNKRFNSVSTWGSYSYSTNNYMFPDLNNSEPFPNNTDIKHAVSFAGTYTKNDVKFALGLNWNSGKPTTLPSSNDITNDDIITYASPNSSNLNNYLRIDFSTTYKFNISNAARASISASIWNLSNRKNTINSYYTLNSENTATKINNESLGITSNISFRIYL